MVGRRANSLAKAHVGDETQVSVRDTKLAVLRFQKKLHQRDQVACQFAPMVPAPVAGLNYTGQTATTVSVMYFSLPANTQIMFVNQINGVTFLPSATVSGSGTLVISLATLPPGPGEYYLLAQESGGWIAQTVRFYL
jgi:hypothetical protein